MTDYSELVKALRCKSLSKKCDSCGYGYHLSPDSECNDACHVEQIYADAADAIEDLEGFLAEAERDRDEYEERMRKEQERVIELQADVGQWKAAVKGQEDGIKVLQAEVERLKDSNEELRDKQTYIDHYGTEWMTSAKDVPTAAYEHGYADGKAEERAKMQKRNAELHAELEKWVSAAEKAGEPKRGEWVRVEDEESYHYECSRCGERPLYSRYGDVVLSGACPMCGAKMEVQDGQE